MDESQSALLEFIDALPEPAFLIDTSMVCLAANRALAERMGQTVAQLVGHDLFSFLPEPVAQSRQAHIREVIQTGRPVVFSDERQGRRFDNHVFPTSDPQGTVRAVAVIAIDVTEMKNAEDELRRREELLRFGFEASGMGVWEWDVGADRVALSPNLSAVASMDLIGRPGAMKTYLEYVHPDDRERIAASLLACAEGRIEVHTQRYRRVLPQSPYVVDRWQEVWGRMFDNGHGGRKMVGTLRDVTSLVEAEQRQQEAHQQVRQFNERLEQRVAERTAALTTAIQELESFCYSVSHDLRAPLRSIDGFSLAVLEDAGDKLDAESRRHLDIVRNEAQRMGRLIDDLLNLSRVSRAGFNAEPVDVSVLAADVVDAQRRREPQRKVEVTIAPSADMQGIGDAGQLRILLDNLIANAWKFSRNQPVAHLSVGREITENGPAFFVRDDGVGFDMRYATKLFEPFQRLHGVAAFEGTGVGLATVKRIVRRHGGKIWAASAVGEGATFYWTLGEAAKEG